jgi:hypothetical protein
MLMAREFPKSQIRLNGPNKSGLSRFDKKEDSGKLKELGPGKFGKSDCPPVRINRTKADLTR